MIKTEEFKTINKNQQVLNGKEVVVTTGIHGNEISPLFVGNALIRYFEVFALPEGINSISIFNGVNIPGIYENTREVEDRVRGDLNRSFFFYKRFRCPINHTKNHKYNRFF